MINFIKHIFTKKSSNKDESLNTDERSYVELPGYGYPSVEDLKLEVVLFEKRVKDYAISLKIELAPSDSKNINLNTVINKLKHSNPYADIDEKNELWDSFIEELHALRKYRNKIIHIDHSDIPSVEELYCRYKNANNRLLPFRLNEGYKNAVFEPIRWIDKTLEISINGTIYHLDYSDIDNLCIQLHPVHRGAVFYKFGKQVVAKITDYDYNNLTIFIEGYPSFKVTEDEAALLEDLILSAKAEKVYGPLQGSQAL